MILDIKKFIEEQLEIESKATPAPWAKDTCGDIWTENKDVPSEFIFQGSDDQIEVKRGIASTRRAPDDPNAAFITESRNNYRRTLLALKEAWEALDYIEDKTWNDVAEKAKQRIEQILGGGE